MPDVRLNSSYRTVIGILLSITLVLVGVTFFFFDPARSSFYPVCMFHKLTGLNCPGCGGLRALHQLTHGNFVTAFHYNPLLMVLLPFITFITLRWQIRGREAFVGNTVLFRPAALWLLLAVTLLFTVLRNLPGPAFEWMSP
ncbi:MAG TPA: DUF2752 domain-containing protein [Verrucomicrobiae bacterium]|nr:DUF2752 domain-containing protein [Verrucomicrobiae bacterium]